MNQKKAKAIRRVVRSVGKVKVELERPRSGVLGYTDPVTRRSYSYDLPLTARYPAGSFRRVYKNMKRGLRWACMSSLREMATALRGHGATA
jgi:hypothetical protein